MSWYGIDQRDRCPGGLDRQPMDAISALVRNMGFNCVRLPYSLESVVDPRPPAAPYEVLAANPGLIGKNSLELIDEMVDSLTSAGLMVILDEHTSKADWCCDARDGDGLWYTKDYSEGKWISALTMLADRYEMNPLFVGMELRNEIRPVVTRQGVIVPTWGDKNLATDWHAAAERAGNAVLAVNPKLLIVVGGLDFGLDLTGVEEHPVRLAVGEKLVYAAHNYVWSCPECMKNRSVFEDKIDRQWGFIMERDIAPVWLSEIGTPHTDDGFIYSGALSEYDQLQGRWWSWLVSYLKRKHPGISFGYWTLDGTQSSGRTRFRGAEETYGILNMEWTAPYAAAHLEQVISLLAYENNGNDSKGDGVAAGGTSAPFGELASDNNPEL